MLEILGWLGGLILILAYAFNSIERLRMSPFWYQMCNLIGSVILIVYTYEKQAYPNVALNIIWAGISIIALDELLKNKVKLKRKLK